MQPVVIEEHDRYLFEKTELDLTVDGISLETLCRKRWTFGGMTEGGSFETHHGYAHRTKNPQKGDYSAKLECFIDITVFDGIKKINKKINVLEISDSDIEKIPFISDTLREHLLDLKWKVC